MEVNLRIVKLDEFRGLPDGTLFMKYEPCNFGDLRVKIETLDSDFLFDSITDEVEASGSDELFDKLFAAEKDSTMSLAMDFDATGRDGMFEAEQLFAVYEKGDICGLIDKLNKCMASYT